MPQLGEVKLLSAAVGQRTACQGGGRASEAHALQWVQFLRRDLAQNSAQLVKIHRLGEMEIESRFSAALDVLSPGKATDCYGFNGSFSFGFGNQVVAAAVGQNNVTQDNIELFRVDHVHRVLRAVSHRNFVAEMTEKTGQR